MFLDNIYADYCSCYDKVWFIVEFEFLIWANIYFWIDSWINNYLIDVMSWALGYESVCLIMIWIYGMPVRIPMLIR